MKVIKEGFCTLTTGFTLPFKTYVWVTAVISHHLKVIIICTELFSLKFSVLHLNFLVIMKQIWGRSTVSSIFYFHLFYLGVTFTNSNRILSTSKQDFKSNTIWISWYEPASHDISPSISKLYFFTDISRLLSQQCWHSLSWVQL